MIDPAPALTTPEPDHQMPGGGYPAPPEPLQTPTTDPRRRTPAEEARSIVAYSSTATLSTLSEDGSPWGSLVMYALLDDGSPVLMVSTLAEHGRNLQRDTRASLVIAPQPTGDPLASARVTLAGAAEVPEGRRAAIARDAYLDAVKSARIFSRFGDFSLWVLNVDRVRWVGGYGVMGSDDAEAYRAAQPDPVTPAADGAVNHLNDDHADALLAIGQALAGYTDATAARCTGIDRYGMDLVVDTPRGPAPARVGFDETLTAADQLRHATVLLARRARGA